MTLICTKSSTTQRAGRSTLDSGASFVVSIQNGIAHLDLLSSLFDEARVGFGATYQAATKIGPGAIRHAGNGKTVLWGHSSAWANLRMAASILRRGGFSASASRAGITHSWEKFAVTCGVNAVAAILRVPLRGIASSRSAREVSIALFPFGRLLPSQESWEWSFRQ